MIEITDVRKEYGDVVALDGVSLSVAGGESLGLVGTNGAGKTTLFRLLVGHDAPDAGSVRVGGVDPTAGTRVRERVGYLPENAGFQPDLTGREVLGFYAAMCGFSEDHPRVDALLGVVGLDDAADRPTGGYSNGMTQRLALAVALLSDPDVLLLDEPTAGLDPGGVDAFNRVVERVREERDVTVVLSTHALREVETLCDRVAVVDDGRLRTAGTVEDVTQSVGAGATVTARYEEPAVAAAVADAVTDASVTVDGSRVTVTCDDGALTAVLAAVVDADPVDVTVDDPDLESAFRETVGLGGEPA